MNIKLHSLLLASAAFLLVAPASARSASASQVASLQSQPEGYRKEKGSATLRDRCEELSRSWTQGNQSIIDACLKSPNLSSKIKQKLERLAQVSNVSQFHLLAQADPLTLENLQRQFNALKEKVNVLESAASASAEIAAEREQELEQTVEILTAEVESLRGQVGESDLSTAISDASSSTTPPPFKPTITFRFQKELFLFHAK